MIPSSNVFNQATMTHLLEIDPVVQDYRTFFALLDWQVVTDEEPSRTRRGRPAHPMSAYLKAFLNRIREGLIYTSQLRRFLLKPPLLIIELGFRLELDPTQPYGFDVDKTLPCEYWLREQLHRFDHDVLQALLRTLVQALKEEIPGLGETVAFDVKHIYAWVRENNPRVYVKGRFDVTHIPTGDPDCRLGVKKSRNQEQPDGSKKEVKESLFGYGSGVAAATNPVYGDVVLADFTQPFNEGDVTYYRPLYRQRVLALGEYPTNVTADAAFDAWYVYQCAALHQGIGAVPLKLACSSRLRARCRWHPALPQRLAHAPDLSVQSHQWLPRPTFPLSLALSAADRAVLRPCSICQREGLCQGCQVGTGRTDARDTGSRRAALQGHLQAAHLV